MPRDAEQALLFRRRHGGLDRVFELVHGRCGEQHGGGRRLREVALEEVRHHGGVHVAVLELDGNAVLLMHDDDVEQALQGAVLEFLVQRRVGVDRWPWR